MLGSDLFRSCTLPALNVLQKVKALSVRHMSSYTCKFSVHQAYIKGSKCTLRHSPFVTSPLRAISEASSLPLAVREHDVHLERRGSTDYVD